MNNKCLSQAFKVTLPVLCGYITLGIAFGLVVVNAGYPWWLSPLSSLIMYSGASQFVAIGLFAANTPLHTILITLTLVGIRHIVYGLSLITKFKNTGKWKFYLIFSLSDETYSLQTTLDPPEGVTAGQFYGTIGLLDQSYWVLGTLIGAVAGQFIPFDFAGVDFSLTALFAVMTVEQILKTKAWGPIIIGTVTTIIAIILMKVEIISSSNILLVSLCAGIAAILITKRKEEDKNDKSN